MVGTTVTTDLDCAAKMDVEHVGELEGTDVGVSQDCGSSVVQFYLQNQNKRFHIGYL